MTISHFRKGDQMSVKRKEQLEFAENQGRKDFHEFNSHHNAPARYTEDYQHYKKGYDSELAKVEMELT
jgi:hypothetical protein